MDLDHSSPHAATSAIDAPAAATDLLDAMSASATADSPSPATVDLEAERFAPRPYEPALLSMARAGEARLAVVFGGQGAGWLPELREMHASHLAVRTLVRACTERLRQSAADARLGALATPAHGFDLARWIEHEAEAPAPEVLASSLLSQAGIFVAQAARLLAMAERGFELDQLVSLASAATGHSQGVMGAVLFAEGHPFDRFVARAAELSSYFFWEGYRMQESFVLAATPPAVREAAQAAGIGEPTPMAALSGLTDELLAEALEKFHAANPQLPPIDPTLDNGYTRKVVSAPPVSLVAFARALAAAREAEKAAFQKGRLGRRPLEFSWEFVAASAPFHSRYMEYGRRALPDDLRREGIRFSPAALKLPVLGNDGRDLRQEPDGDALLQTIVRMFHVEPVRWPRVCAALRASHPDGLTHVLELGPGDAVAKLTAVNCRGFGVHVFALATESGRREALKSRDELPRGVDYRRHAPRLSLSPSGAPVLDNAFTRFTGRPPVFLPGMTPTTVEADVVAAAANAGFVAELAGGGQVTERIFRLRAEELAQKLEPGSAYVVNLLHLDPYLWNMHWKNRLVTSVRAEGSAIEGVTVSAGVPELDEAVELVRTCLAHGIRLVSFKPGTVKQIEQVLEIAKAVPDQTIGVQIEGGKSGGHHSWEDLRDLVRASYPRLRERPNVLLSVGGGIRDEEDAFQWLSGGWSEPLGLAPMPVDAVFIGTRCMAAKEAKTSPQVKALLAKTAGTDEWVAAGQSRGGVTSGKSQLDADIHYADNAAARVGRLLDEVAGDEKAALARKGEIIAALATTAKPYFGDLTEMSAAAALRRMVELLAVGRGTRYEDGRWPDESYRLRVHDFARHLEERLAAQPGPSIVQAPADLDDPEAFVARFVAAYPGAETMTLSRADADYFVQRICARPGKPVAFVPVIDAQIRRWYKSDALWQSHDDRYDADSVLVIPGPTGVQGIREVDEPVAEILGAFVRHAIAKLTARGEPVTATADAIDSSRIAQVARGAGLELDSEPGGVLVARPQTTRLRGNAPVPDGRGTGQAAATGDGDADADRTDRTDRSDRTSDPTDPTDPTDRSDPATGRERRAMRWSPQGGGNGSSDADRFSAWLHALDPLVLLPLARATGVMRGREVSPNPLGLMLRVEPGDRWTATADTAGRLASLVVQRASGHAIELALSRDGTAGRCEVTLVHALPADRPPVRLALSFELDLLHPGRFPREVTPDRAERLGHFFGASMLADGAPVPAGETVRATFTVDADFVREYALASGDASMAHLGGRGHSHAMPLNAAFSAAFAAIFRSTFVPGVAWDPSRLVHLRNSVRRFGPAVREGETVEVTARLVLWEPTRDGVRVRTEAVLEQDGEKRATIDSTFFVRGESGSFRFRDERRVHRLPDDAALRALLAEKPWCAGAGEGPLDIDLSLRTIADATGLHAQVRGKMLDPSGKLVATIHEDQDGIDAAETEPALWLGRFAPVTDERVSLPRPSPAHVEETTAPWNLADFARASRDFNPLHRDAHVAALAGFDQPIVHGQWTAARAVATAAAGFAGTDGERVRAIDASFTDVVLPGDPLQFRARHVAMDAGDLVVEVEAHAQRGEEDRLALKGLVRLAAPRTAYVFPGQGVQSTGMGMDGYQRSPAARRVWDEADAYCRDVLGFSLLTVVRDNPNEMRVGLDIHRHDQGVLFLTQFTQVAMAVLAIAQIEELREAGSFQEDAPFCGHSVGEYSAIGAITKALSLGAIVETVYQRGLTMQTFVPRDKHGRSPYRMAVVRPNVVRLAERDLVALTERIARETGGLCEVVNYNIRGRQYSVVGHVPALKALRERIAERQAPGSKPAYLEVPGIDVPFHSKALRGGVPAFREKLEHTIPQDLDVAPLVGRYIPNVVARPFALSRAYLDDLIQSTGSEVLTALSARWESPGNPARPDDRSDRSVGSVRSVRSAFGGNPLPGDEPTTPPAELGRALFIEGLAYQFASPVRWIETQDLLLARGPFGVARVVEIGVASAPTQANMFRATLAMDPSRLDPPAVFNVEADRKAVFHLYEPEDDSAARADAPEPRGTGVPARESPAGGAGVRVSRAPTGEDVRATRPVAKVEDGLRAAPVSDSPLTVRDSLVTLLALKARVRADEVRPEESIEQLFGGNSSRRNQVLADIGAEFGIGAVDGAHEMPVATLIDAVTKATGGRYQAQGPYLRAQVTAAIKPFGLSTKDVLGLVSSRGLPEGRSLSLLNRVALWARPGDSTRAGALSPVAPPKPGDKPGALAWVEAALARYAEEEGFSLASATAAQGGQTVDAAALDQLLAKYFGVGGALFESLRFAQGAFGHDVWAAFEAKAEEGAEERERLGRYDAEHGAAYEKAIRPAFASEKAVSFAGSWAWARRDALELYHRLRASRSSGMVPPGSSRAISPGSSGAVSPRSSGAVSPRSSGAVSPRSSGAVSPRSSRAQSREGIVEATARIARAADQKTAQAVDYLCRRAEREGDAEAASVLAALASRIDPKALPCASSEATPLRPTVQVLADGTLRDGDVARGDASGALAVAEELLASGNARLRLSSAGSLARHDDRSDRSVGSDRSVRSASRSGNDPCDQKNPREVFDSSLLALARGEVSFAGRTALVTGASDRSIAIELVKLLLTGGARVVVTTSQHSPERVRFYRRLFQRYGARGAELAVVPFNQGSRQDIQRLVTWLVSTEKTTVGGTQRMVKEPWLVDLLVPFGAIGEEGTLADISDRSMATLRVLLYGVEALVSECAQAFSRLHVRETRTHVVLPLSPNHGQFGNDGLYGETKAALEAMLNRWGSEQGAWGRHTSVVGARIGWVRGTGLMNVNDAIAPGLEEAAGVRTFSAPEMGLLLGACCTDGVRALAAKEPLVADLTGGMDRVRDLSSIARTLRSDLTKQVAHAKRLHQLRLEEARVLGREATPMHQVTPAPRYADYFAFPALPPVARRESLSMLRELDLSRVAVIVGLGELGPFGGSRPRWSMESEGELSLEACVELAWMTGRIRFERNAQHVGWVDAKTGESVREQEVKARYERALVESSGIRFADETSAGFDPRKLTAYADVVLEQDFVFPVPSQKEGEAYVAAAGQSARLIFDAAKDGWFVVRKKGSTVKVARAARLDRYVAGQIPTGWDPARYGIPKDLAEQVDRTTLFNLVATVEAFLAAGLEPEELYEYLHPSQVGNTQGAGIGGMQKLKRLYVDHVLDRPRQGDALQETLINVTAAWVVQSLIGSYGPMVHPVGACATAAVSLEVATDKVTSGQAAFIVAGGFDDYGEEGALGFMDMSATCDTDDMLSRGIPPREMSRPNDRRRRGFVEAQGGGTMLVARADLAVRMGLPIYAVVALARTFGDGLHRSIPAPGPGVMAVAAERKARAGEASGKELCDLARRHAEWKAFLRTAFPGDGISARRDAGQVVPNAIDQTDRTDRTDPTDRSDPTGESGRANPRESLRALLGDDGADAILGAERRRHFHDFAPGDERVSPLRRALAVFGLTPDDIAAAWKHDTSTDANDPNENRVYDRILRWLGRDSGNPLVVASQKALTGHSKGGAAAWQVAGLCQALATGIVPGNPNLDDPDPDMRAYESVAFTDRPIRFAPGAFEAGLVSSLGFGHVGGIVCLVHPDRALAALDDGAFAAYAEKRARRERTRLEDQLAILESQRPAVRIRAPKPFVAPAIEDYAPFEPEQAALLDAGSRRLEREGPIVAGGVLRDLARPDVPLAEPRDF